MYFRQILHEDLGCASYILADDGEAAVVDPKWEVDEYLRAAEEAGAAIEHVLETHTHADHVSGRGALADATGAVVHLPADPDDPDSDGLHDGDEIRVGRVTLRVLAAPGHRPEHLAYLVLDGDQPRLLLSGDSLLIGDVARPDLAVEPSEGAGALFETLRRFDAFEDELELFPAHVGGSLCGSRSLSSETSSTLGHERSSNAMFSVPARETFVAELTRAAPPRPPTMERVVELNRRGERGPARLPELDVSALAEFVSRGGCLLDVRPSSEFDSAHLAGAVNLVTGSKGVGSRAGWAVGTECPTAIVAATSEDAREVVSLLLAAGLWNLEGIATADADGWSAAGLEVRSSGALDPERVVPRLAAAELRLLDVRDPDEWESGHVDHSLHLPIAGLANGQASSLPAGEPLAVACASGARAALAASVLRRRGHTDVWRVDGGVEDIARHGAPWVNGEG